MRMETKKPLKVLAKLALLEVVIYLVTALIAWAVVWHDAEGLSQAFYGSVGSKLSSQIVAGMLGLCVLVNLAAATKVYFQGQKPIAIVPLLMTVATVSLFFLPTLYSLLALGGIIALFSALAVLRLLWRGVSWPFRKIFRRKPKTEAAAKPAAAPKAAGKTPASGTR